MKTTVKYSERKSFSLETEMGIVASVGQPRGEPLDDVVAAVAAALVDPLDFPPIPQAVVPGDRIAIAIDASLPRPTAVVAGIVQPLLEADIVPQNITVVVAREYSDPPALTRLLAAECRDNIKVARHDPNDNNAVAYLAASAEGQPIYVNRIICDADLVIPVSAATVDLMTGRHAGLGGVFPSFADTATQQRFAAPVSNADSGGELRLREMEEAAWLLGARLAVQLVWGQGDTLLHVVAGDMDTVRQRSGQLSAAAWDVEVPQRARLVVAAIEGGRSQQTWASLSRALAGAARVVEEDGAIAVCCSLSEAPGPALQQLIGAGSPAEAEMRIAENLSHDAETASRLVQVIRNTRVYLLSDLSESIVNDLGMAFVKEPHEIENLVRRHESCILLSNAQHAWPSLKDTALSS